uniref:Uncharacterized protein n=1 Tax=Rhizophora mucronata TaxID=61149 RepID=A0A2P2QUS4_RHIMU
MKRTKLIATICMAGIIYSLPNLLNSAPRCKNIMNFDETRVEMRFSKQKKMKIEYFGCFWS